MAILRSQVTRGKRGRPKNAEPRVRWSITLRETIAAPWDMLFLDPIIGKARQNTRNAVLEALLHQVMESFRDGQTVIDISHIHQLMREKLLTPPD